MCVTCNLDNQARFIIRPRFTIFCQLCYPNFMPLRKRSNTEKLILSRFWSKVLLINFIFTLKWNYFSMENFYFEPKCFILMLIFRNQVRRQMEHFIKGYLTQTCYLKPLILIHFKDITPMMTLLGNKSNYRHSLMLKEKANNKRNCFLFHFNLLWSINCQL